MDTTAAWKHWEAWISAGHGTRRPCPSLRSSTFQPNLSPHGDVTNQLAQMVASLLLNLKDMGSSPANSPFVWITSRCGISVIGLLDILYVHRGTYCTSLEGHSNHGPNNQGLTLQSGLGGLFNQRYLLPTKRYHKRGIILHKGCSVGGHKIYAPGRWGRFTKHSSDLELCKLEDAESTCVTSFQQLLLKRLQVQFYNLKGTVSQEISLRHKDESSGSCYATLITTLVASKILGLRNFTKL